MPGSGEITPAFRASPDRIAAERASQPLPRRHNDCILKVRDLNCFDVHKAFITLIIVQKDIVWLDVYWLSALRCMQSSGMPKLAIMEKISIMHISKTLQSTSEDFAPYFRAKRFQA
ncbi:hypothetical protein A7D00_0064 [Trichophyton violaceum]|uniref:Uncharacterized protein n=1 Tax=Trichophyton violaceum TaxID=34388 RepID=A0A178FPN9_TRIVO|nr:hypothetical protein A7D00_0064 [Trichophyton violaceum]